VALIEVAHPRHRAELFVKAQRMGYVPAEQTLRNMRAYPVEEETQLAITRGQHAGESVMLRPSASNDGDGIRDLFHRLSDRDRYTRFFRKVRGLSDRDVQRLCNMNFETEVAFVAVSGTRENPRIVAQACYFTDPGTNLAETAFMVHPDWQGCGLGEALQRRMAEHARSRGVLGLRGRDPGQQRNHDPPGAIEPRQGQCGTLRQHGARYDPVLAVRQRLGDALARHAGLGHREIEPLAHVPPARCRACSCTAPFSGPRPGRRGRPRWGR
jgi:GNAT superfamily N-acetyltransferase